MSELIDSFRSTPGRARREILVGILALSVAGCGAVVDLPRDDGGTASVGGSTSNGGTASVGGSTSNGGTAGAGGSSNSGGVWQDPTSGLTWQVQATFPAMNLAAGQAHCEALVQGGHDDWRLPTISELRSLMRGCPDTVTGGPCGETDTCSSVSPQCYDGDKCLGCFSGQGPGVNGCYWPSEMGAGCGWFWSRTPAGDVPDYACFAHFGEAHLSHDDDTHDVGHFVICVR